MCSVGVPLPGFPQGIGQRFGILATLWLVQEEAGRAMELDHSPRWCRALLDGTGALMTELYVQTRTMSSQTFVPYAGGQDGRQQENGHGNVHRLCHEIPTCPYGAAQRDPAADAPYPGKHAALGRGAARGVGLCLPRHR